MAAIVALSTKLWVGERADSKMYGSHPALKRPGPVLLLLSSLVFLACLPALKSDFLADDFAHLHLFHRLTSTDFFKLFTTEFSQGIWKAGYNELRPLAALFYKFSCVAFGTNAVGYHAFDIAVHILNTCLVFRLVGLLVTDGIAVPATAALFFGLAPVHAEPISWISGARADSYPTFFYLVSVCTFVSFQKSSRAASYVLAWFSFVVGLFTKEILITLPAVVLALAFCFNPRRKPQLLAHFRQSTLVGAPFVFAALGYLWWRWLVFGTLTRGEPVGWAQVRRLLVEQDLNLRQLLVPFLLEPTRLSQTRLGQVILLLGAGALLGSLWAGTILWRKSSSEGSISISIVLGLGVLWYLLSQAPLAFAYSSERHLYLPSIGFYVALAAWLIPDSAAAERRWPRVAGVCVAIILFGGTLFQRTKGWGEMGELSHRMRQGLHRLKSEVPADSWVMVTAPDLVDGKYVWNWALPFALQPPFTHEDLYARLRILETPMLYCCPMPDWWSKQRQLLTKLLSPALSEPAEVYDCRWDASQREITLEKVLVNRSDLRNRLEARMGRSLAELEVPGLGTAALVWDSLQTPLRFSKENQTSLAKDLTRAFIDREAFIEPENGIPQDIHSGKSAFLSRFSKSGEERPCLVTVANSRIRFLAPGLPKSWLRFGIALVDNPLDPVDAQVTLREADGTEHLVFFRRLNPRRLEGDRYWQDFQVHLPSVGAGTREITIEARATLGTGTQLGWNGLEIVRQRE